MNRILGSLLNRIAFVCPGGFRVRPAIHRARGVKVGANVWIGLYVHIDDVRPAALTIEENCSIGMRTSIFTHFSGDPRRPESNGRVVIEKNVFIGPHCVIMPNVRIGEGSVIRAGTVVTRNVPPQTFWGAPPAEPLGQVTVPLTEDGNYTDFLRGIRPLRRDGTKPSSRRLSAKGKVQ